MYRNASTSVKEMGKSTPFIFMVVLSLMPKGLHPPCCAFRYLQNQHKTNQTQLNGKNKPKLIYVWLPPNKHLSLRLGQTFKEAAIQPPL